MLPMASGNINCPLPNRNALFHSAVDCLHSPNLYLPRDPNSNLPLMFNPDLADVTPNNNQLLDTVLSANQNQSLITFPDHSSNASETRMRDSGSSVPTMLVTGGEIPSTIPQVPDVLLLFNNGNNSELHQSNHWSDQGREKPDQLNISFVPCKSSDVQPPVESKESSPKVALCVPPRPANWVSPPNIPLVFDITPDEKGNIPELFTKHSGYTPGDNISASDIPSVATSENNDRPNNSPQPCYDIPRSIQFNHSPAQNERGAIPPNLMQRPDYRIPSSALPGENKLHHSPSSYQSSAVRPDYRIPLVLCTPESNSGEAFPYRSGLVPGMLGGAIPEELSVSVDSSGEGHSWRPGLTNALSEDFFLPPLSPFAGRERGPRNSDQTDKDSQSYIESQKAELNILRYEVMNAQRRINETKSYIETVSKHLNNLNKFQNIAEMEKLTKENAQLRLECQCLCMEVDFYHKGQAPLGEVDEKFYKHSTERKAAAEASTSAEDEEGDQWECHKCTFVNHPAIRDCEICHVPRRTKRHNAAPRHPYAEDACYCHPQKR